MPAGRPPSHPFRRRLKRAGWSQRALAEELGISPQHLSNLLHRSAFASLDVGIRLAQELGVPAERFTRQEKA